MTKIFLPLIVALLSASALSSCARSPVVSDHSYGVNPLRNPSHMLTYADYVREYSGYSRKPEWAWTWSAWRKMSAQEVDTYREGALCVMVFSVGEDEVFRFGQPDSVCEHADAFHNYEDQTVLGPPLVTGRAFRDEHGFGVGSAVSDVIARDANGRWHVWAGVDPDGYQAGRICNTNGVGGWTVSYAFSFESDRPLVHEKGDSYAADIEYSDLGGKVVVGVALIPECGN